jgi:hypothetical protein
MAMLAATGGHVRKAIVLAGASHARKLVPHLDSLGFNTIVVETPRWKPNTITVSTALEQTLKMTSNVVADLFTCLDGAVFYAMMDDRITYTNQQGQRRCLPCLRLTGCQLSPPLTCSPILLKGQCHEIFVNRSPLGP